MLKSCPFNAIKDHALEDDADGLEEEENERTTVQTRTRV